MYTCSAGDITPLYSHVDSYVIYHIPIIICYHTKNIGTLENLHDTTFPVFCRECYLLCIYMYVFQILALQSLVRQTVSMAWIDLLIATAVRRVNVVCNHHNLL